MAGGLNTKLLLTIYDVLGLRSLFDGENPSPDEKLRGYFIISPVLPVPCRLGGWCRRAQVVQPRL
jgi:hypothetical protein